MCRGSPLRLRMVPRPAAPTVADGAPRLTWLRTFYDSARNVTRARS